MKSMYFFAFLQMVFAIGAFCVCSNISNSEDLKNFSSSAKELSEGLSVYSETVDSCWGTYKNTAEAIFKLENGLRRVSVGVKNVSTFLTSLGINFERVNILGKHPLKDTGLNLQRTSDKVRESGVRIGNLATEINNFKINNHPLIQKAIKTSAINLKNLSEKLGRNHVAQTVGMGMSLLGLILTLFFFSNAIALILIAKNHKK